MRLMVSRSTFSWDQIEVTEDTTKRRQSRGTIFFMTRAPGGRSNRGLYSVGFLEGPKQIVNLFQGRGRHHAFLPESSVAGRFVSSGFFSPLPALGFASSSSLFLTMYCTIS